MWGVSINASLTDSSTIEMTSSISLPHMVYVLPPVQGAPTPTSKTTTLTPPPYPWSQTVKDTALNTKTTTWSSGPPTPSTSKGSKGAGKGCAPFCRGPCLFCPPDWSDIVGGGSGGGGGSDGSDEEDCSTETAQVCTTVCVEGSGCDFDCSTTTGCSVTASSTKYVGTPAPGVAFTVHERPTVTPSPEADISLALDLDLTLSSEFGTLSVISGPSPSPTGAAPMNGPNPGRITISYYWNDQTGDGQWDLYEFYENGEGIDECPEVQTPDFVKTDGAYKGLGDGDGGFKAFGSTCTYKGTNLPTGQIGQKVGVFVCNGYRDAICYAGNGALGTCSQGWLSVFELVTCQW